MGTIQKILDNLQNLRGDKINKLTTRFDEHSSWLSSELNLIAKLVVKNGSISVPTGTRNEETVASAMPAPLVMPPLPPTAKVNKQAQVASYESSHNFPPAAPVVQALVSSSGGGARAALLASKANADAEAKAARASQYEQQQKSHSAGGESAAVSMTCAPSSVSMTVQEAAPVVTTTATADDSDVRRQKRKSPDQPLSNIKLSPEQKRSSSDHFEKVAVEAGFPVDLSRMKKEHLLNELEKLGHVSLNMKCLKKDIVDQLKQLLLEEYSKKSAVKVQAEADAEAVATQNVSTAASVDTSNINNMHSTTPTPISPRQNGNCMSDYRQHMNDTNTQKEQCVTNETEEQKKSRIQSEFNRRLSKAQSRKSSVGADELEVAQTEVREEIEMQDEEVEEEEVFVEQALPTDTRHSLVSRPLTPVGFSPVKATSVVGLSPMRTSPTVSNAAYTSPGISQSNTQTAQAHNQNLVVAQENRTSDASASPDTWMEVASPQPDHTHTYMENGISLELQGNSPQQVSSKVNVNVNLAVSVSPVKHVPTSVPVAAAPTNTTTHSSSSRTAVQVNSLMMLSNPGANVHNATVAQGARSPQREPPKMKGSKGASTVAEKIAAFQQPSKTESVNVAAAAVTTNANASANIEKKAISGIVAASAIAIDNKIQAMTIQKAAAATTAVSSVAGTNTNVAAAVVPVKKVGLFSFMANKDSAAVPSLKPEVAVVQAVVPAAIVKVDSPVSAAVVHTAPIQQQQQKITPVKSPPPKTVEEEYRIDDGDDSDGSGSGTDDDESSSKKQANKIPDWARGTQLKEALEKQYGMYGHVPMDPDVIFPQVQTCSLEEIFGTNGGRSGKYSHRSSSAKWEQDEITLVETRTYRKQMGLGAV